MLFTLAVIGLSLISQPIHSFELKATGQTVQLDGIDYYLPAEPVTSIHAPNAIHTGAGKPGGLTPLTVVIVNNTAFTRQSLHATVASYRVSDDVFTDSFLSNIYLQYVASRPRGYSIPEYSNSTNATIHVFSSFVKNATILPPGPYFLSSTGQVYQAWRLYSDFAGAFTESVIANPDGSFGVLSAGLPGQSLAIAVPSRLYYTKSAEKPLAGVRLGIKDIYDIAGLRTGNGNRAWYHLYGPAIEHATPVKRLIDAGAVIVGKMITSQFANGEEATAVSALKAVDPSQK